MGTDFRDLRSGLKTGVENDIFWSAVRSGFGIVVVVVFNSVLLIGLKLQIEISSNSFFL